MTTYEYEKIIVALFACFVITTTATLMYILKPAVKTLMCDDKLIVKSNKLYLDNNMWVWENGTYTPAGGEICVLIKGDDK